MSTPKARHSLGEADSNPLTHADSKPQSDNLAQMISYNLTQMNFLKSHTDLTDLSDKTI